jgi:protein TonB
MPTSDSAAAPTPDPLQNAQMAWQRKVIARLFSLHGLPPGIAATGTSATADVLIEIDRKGHIIYFRITKSSGDPALDHAVRNLVRHADPLPPPPPLQDEKPDAPRSFVISIGYYNKPN